MLQSPVSIGLTLSSLPFALVAFQSLLLCLVLALKKSDTPNLQLANRAFALLLLVFCLMLIEHTMDLAGYFFLLPGLIDVVTPLYFLIGPLLYTYVLFQVSPKTRAFEQRQLWHLLPALLVLLILSPYLMSKDFDGKLLLYYERYFPELSNAESDLVFECDMSTILSWLTCDVRLALVENQPQFDIVFFSPIALIWLFDIDSIALWLSLVIYILASLKRLKQHRGILRQLTSDINGLDLAWLQHFTWLFSATVILFLFFSIQDSFFDNFLDISEVTSNYYVYGLISINIVYVSIRALLQPQLFSPELANIAVQLDIDKSDISRSQAGDTAATDCDANTKYSEKDFLSSKSKTKLKYQNSPVTTPLSKDLARLINQHMKTQESYLNPQLTLPELAGKLSISPHILSQVLNETLNQNFFEFVNSFRIEKAKTLLLDSNKSSVIQVAMDSGFNSKTAFYTAFRKRLGKTPRQWCQQQINK